MIRGGPRADVQPANPSYFGTRFLHGRTRRPLGPLVQTLRRPVAVRVDHRSRTQTLQATSRRQLPEDALDRRPTLQFRASPAARPPVPAVVTFERLALVPARRRKLTPTQVEVAPTPRTSSWRIVSPPPQARRPPVIELMALAALVGLIAGFGAGVWLQSTHDGADEPALASAR